MENIASKVDASFCPFDIIQAVTLAKTPRRAAKGKSVMKASVRKVNLC